MKITALALSLSTAAVLAGSARAESLITFDPRPPGSHVGIEGYTEGGMLFDDALSPGSVIAADSGAPPSNGSAFLSKCGICRPSMRAAEGGLFDLVALDVGEHLIFGFGPFPTGFRITGTREDGSEAVADLTTDGIAGFETFVLGDAFSDLASVEFTTSPYTAIGIDDVAVLVGAEKPTLAISPPNGLYVTAQVLDLTMIVRGTEEATLVDAILDGVNVLDFVTDCAVEGSLDVAPGLTLRCPLDAADLGPGTHVFEASLEIADGVTLRGSAEWEVLGNAEP